MQGSAVTEAPTDGITYKRGDYIGGAQVEQVAGSGAAFRPNYIFSSTTYHYAVFSVNGPAGYENYRTGDALKGSVTTLGKSYGTYYASVDPTKPTFITSLTARIKIHDTVFYSYYIPRLVNTWLARDTSGGKKVVTCVYTGSQFVYDEPFQWANGSNGATLTREHTWAQSWMPSNQGNPDWPSAPGTTKELPEFSDLHNLFPAHQANANLRRSNYPFGVVVTPTYTSPTGLGKLGKDSANQTVYEPRPEHKGDLARALFYMAVCYNGSASLNWYLPGIQNQNILREWNRQDPPDAYEIARNEFIASVQGNRNPFIDHPEWADRINFSNLTYISGVKQPALEITRPTGSDQWGFDVSNLVSWNSSDIDSITILLSQDSMQTWEVIAASLPANADSFIYIRSGIFAKPYGVVVIKDLASSAADTSSYFFLKASMGLKSLGDNSFKVFPNPAGNTLFVHFPSGEFTGDLVLFDLSGRQVFRKKVEPDGMVDLSSVAHGIYSAKIENPSGQYNFRLVKAY